MTVRISKPSFNIRERLSELERPIGVKGNELMRAETAQEARELVSAGRKNLIINGDMRISQRGDFTTDGINGFSLNNYTVDRWKFNSSGAGTDFFQHITADQPENLRGSKSVKMTIKSTETFYRRLQQPIEEYQRFKLGDYYTISFWYKAKSSSQYLRCAYWIDGNFYEISLLDTSESWKYFSKTFTIQRTSTSSIDFNIGFQSSTGAAVSGIIGDYFEFTGFQLEVGKNATEFEHRSYDEELRLCQRYYQRFYNSSANTARTSTIFGYNATRSFGSISLSVPLRYISPTITFSGLVLEQTNLGSTINITSILPYGNLAEGGGFMGIECKASSGITGGTSYFLSFSNDTYLALDSEL